MVNEKFFNGLSFNEIIGDIQAQFKNTNNADLLSDLVAVFETYIFGAWKSLYFDNFYLSTAKGDALDLWGFMLGMHRLFKGSNANVNNFNFDKKRFYELLFWKNRSDIEILADDAFREILLLIYQKQFIGNTTKEINAFLNSFFVEYGGIRVKDSQDMHSVYIYFLENLPSYLIYYIARNDILPRPACCGINAGEQYNRAFSFETADKEYNANVVGNFYLMNFLDISQI